MKKLLGVLKNVAPSLAMAIPGVGPLATTALKVVTGAIGAPAGTPPDTLAKMISGDQEAMAKITAANEKFALEHEAELERIAAADRKDARAMNVSLGGKGPQATISYIAIFAFLAMSGVVGYMALKNLGMNQDVKEILIMVVNYLHGFVSAAALFWFGSSAAKEKD